MDLRGRTEKKDIIQEKWGPNITASVQPWIIFEKKITLIDYCYVYA